MSLLFILCYILQINVEMVHTIKKENFFHYQRSTITRNTPLQLFLLDIIGTYSDREIKNLCQRFMIFYKRQLILLCSRTNK